jgi:hypothetical protein
MDKAKAELLEQAGSNDAHSDLLADAIHEIERAESTKGADSGQWSDS